MKFSSTFILAVLPLLSELAAGSPLSADGVVLNARQQRGGQQNQRQAGAAAQRAKAAAAAQKAKQAQAAAAAAKAKGNKGKNAGNGTAAATTAAAAGAAQSSAAAGGAANNAGAGAAAGGAAAGGAAAGGAAAGGAAAGGAAAGGAAAGGAAAGGNQDPQTSLTLDPRVISKGFQQDGQQVPQAGQVASLTSSNNFINFCLTVPNLPLTDGKQIQTGSCNTAPIGVIPDVDHMPSSKFVFPKNGQTIPADQAFTVQMAIRALNAGNFVNAQTNYFAAPQQVAGNGNIVGHTHVTIETIPALDSTTPLNPKNFIFFKGVNTAQNAQGIVTADVTAGLPAGTYRMCSINTSANHTPAIVPVAQHGALDDCSYFTTTAGGAAAAGAANAGAAAGAANAGAANAGAANAGAAAAGGAAAGAANGGKNAAAGAANAGAAAAGGAAAGAAAANAGKNAAGAANAGKNAAAAGTAAAGTAAAGAKNGGAKQAAPAAKGGRNGGRRN